MASLQPPDKQNQVVKGNVYVMTHSFFTDVVRIGCTPDDPELYAQKLSSNTPGDYKLIYTLCCENPCQVKQQIREYLNAQKYVNEFYQVSPDLVKKLMKQENLRIPMLDG